MQETGLSLSLWAQKLILWKKNNLIKNKKLGDTFLELGPAPFKLCDHGLYSLAECPDSPQHYRASTRYVYESTLSVIIRAPFTMVEKTMPWLGWTEGFAASSGGSLTMYRALAF